MRTFHINYLSLAWFWMWFNFIADSKYQFVTVSGFLLRFSVGSCWRAASVEQRADWGADALCPAEISPLSQHQILWSSNLWTALTPRFWKCLRPKQFQTAQPRDHRLYTHPLHLTGAARCVHLKHYTLFISVAIILQLIFVVMPLCIVIHFCLSCLLGTVLSVLYLMMNLVSSSIEQSGSKRRRKEDCDSNFEADSGSRGSTHCPVKKHECRLYELYLSKWWVIYKYFLFVFYLKNFM